MRAWRRPRLDSCHRRAGGRKRLRRHFAFAGLPGIRSPARRKWSHGLPCEEFRLVRGDSLILMTLSGLGEWLPSGLRDYVLAPERACVDEDYKVFPRSEEHTSELQSLTNLVCRLLLEIRR